MSNAFEFVPYITIRSLEIILTREKLFDKEKDGDLADLLFSVYNNDSACVLYLVTEAEYDETDKELLNWLSLEEIRESNITIKKINNIINYIHSLFPSANKILVDVTW